MASNKNSLVFDWQSAWLRLIWVAMHVPTIDEIISGKSKFFEESGLSHVIIRRRRDNACRLVFWKTIGHDVPNPPIRTSCRNAWRKMKMITIRAGRRGGRGAAWTDRRWIYIWGMNDKRCAWARRSSHTYLIVFLLQGKFGCQHWRVFCHHSLLIWLSRRHLGPRWQLFFLKSRMTLVFVR